VGALGAPINEAVNFLDKFNPAALEELRKTLPPELAPLLEPGGLAGRVDGSTKHFAQVQVASLAEAIHWCDEAGGVAGARLRRAKQLNLAAGLVGLVGSSSVLATVAAQSMTLTVASGSVALAGSVLSFMADYTTRPEQGRKKTLYDVYSELSQCRQRAVQIRGELEMYLKIGINSDREPIVIKLIGEANALSLSVNDLRSHLLL